MRASRHDTIPTIALAAGIALCALLALLAGSCVARASHQEKGGDVAGEDVDPNVGHVVYLESAKDTEAGLEVSFRILNATTTEWTAAFSMQVTDVLGGTRTEHVEAAVPAMQEVDGTVAFAGTGMEDVASIDAVDGECAVAYSDAIAAHVATQAGPDD